MSLGCRCSPQEVVDEEVKDVHALKDVLAKRLLLPGAQELAEAFHKQREHVKTRMLSLATRIMLAKAEAEGVLGDAASFQKEADEHATYGL